MADALNRYREAVELSLGETGPPTCPNCGSEDGSLGTAGAYFICRGLCAAARADRQSVERYWTEDHRPAPEWVASLKASPWGRKSDLTAVLEDQIEIHKREIDQLKDAAGAMVYMGNTADHWYKKAKAYGGMVFGVNPILGAREGETTKDAARRAMAEIDRLKGLLNEAGATERRLNVEVLKILGRESPTDPEQHSIPPQTLARDLVAAKLEIEQLKEAGRAFTPGPGPPPDLSPVVCARQTWCIAVDGHAGTCWHPLDEPKPEPADPVEAMGERYLEALQAWTLGDRPDIDEYVEKLAPDLRDEGRRRLEFVRTMYDARPRLAEPPTLVERVMPKSALCPDCDGSGVLGTGTSGRPIACENCGGNEDQAGTGRIDIEPEPEASTKPSSMKCPGCRMWHKPPACDGGKG